MKKACVLLAPGCEEMEAVIVIDVLRRGGVEVVAVGLQEGVFEASRGVKLCPDLPLDEFQEAKDCDLLVLPGGIPGTHALRDDPRVRDLLFHYFQSPGKTVGVICAASLVLDAHGLLDGRTFTCYPVPQPIFRVAPAWMIQWSSTETSSPVRARARPWLLLLLLSNG